MASIDSILRKVSSIYFLIEIDLGSEYLRYTTKNIKVDAEVLFEGKLLRNPIIRKSFDFYSRRYAVSSVSITIENTDSLQNKNFLENKDATIYIYTDGMSWSQTQSDGVIFKGVFKTESYDKYQYRFKLVEKYRTLLDTLPQTTINDDTWSTHRTIGGGGSIAGKTQPIVFGKFDAGVPLLPVDTSAFVYLATQNVTNSVDADYTATTQNVYDKDGSVIGAANYTYYRGIDEQGNMCSYFDFTADQTSNEPLTCSIEGVTYNISGSNILLEHPSDIIKYLFDVYSNVSTNAGAFATAKMLLSSYRYRVYLNIQKPGVEIIDRIATSCFAARRIELNGDFGIVVLNLDDAPKKAVLNFDIDALGKSYNCSKTPDNLVCNDLLVKYKHSPASNTYDGVYNFTRFNNENCDLSYRKYGAQPQVVLQTDAADEATAKSIGNKYLQFFSHRHDIIEVEVPHYLGVLLREFDAADITAEVPGFTNEKMILLERTFSEKSIRQKWWRVKNS